MKEKKPYVSPEIKTIPFDSQVSVLSPDFLKVVENCLIETRTKTLLRGSESSRIPCNDSIVRIGDYAFFGCTELKSIVIPGSVKSIGTAAFQNSGLNEIYYIGTKEDWSLISVGTENQVLKSAIRYNYKEIKPIDAPQRYWHYVNGIPTKW